MPKKQTDRIVLLYVIRIIACFGVINGHFLNLYNQEFLYSLRNSLLFKNTLLAYFYKGDLCVEVFFVLGGFLIPLSTSEEFSYKKIIKKWSGLIIPAIILTVLVGFIYASIARVTSVSIKDSLSFNQCISDIMFFLTGKGLDSSELPNVITHLWFVFPFVKAWIISYVIHHVCKNQSIVSVILLITMYYMYLGFGFQREFGVPIGLLFGELYIRNSKKHYNKILVSVVAIIAFSLCPVLYSTPVYNSHWRFLAERILLGIGIFMISNLDIQLSHSGVIEKIAGKTMGMYYMHWTAIIIPYHFIYLRNNWGGGGYVIVMYIISIFFTYVLSTVSERAVFQPVQKYTRMLLG